MPRAAGAGAPEGPGERSSANTREPIAGAPTGRRSGVSGSDGAQSVWLTDEGARLSEELFQRHFGQDVSE